MLIQANIVGSYLTPHMGMAEQISNVVMADLGRRGSGLFAVGLSAAIGQVPQFRLSEPCRCAVCTVLRTAS